MGHVEKWWVSAVAGAAVFFFGLALLRWAARGWHEQKNDSALDDDDRWHYYRRYRRRTQVGVLFVFVGVLLAVGEVIVDWRQHKALFAVYWIGVMLLLVWAVLLAIGDMVATRHHSQVALARVRYKQRALEQKLAEFRSRRGNGRGAEPPQT